MWGLFFIAFLIGPVRMLHGLDLMPGDLGDARLNNYFLENIYQFIAGNSPSLIHLNFFSPFPFVLGFSDNLFGVSPIYLLFRVITSESDTAFQLWFYCSYLLNYVAAYWGLRLLGISPIASICGALIFSFCLPVSAKIAHVQLAYRFFIPLCISYFYLFLGQRKNRYLFYSAAWLVWGYYCSIYLGIFTTLFLIISLIIYLSFDLIINRKASDFKGGWFKDIRLGHIKNYVLILLALIAVMVLLMYPYFFASKLYGFKRNFSEILMMLPSVKNYFLADKSLLWGSYSTLIEESHFFRHEKQLFIGLVPMTLLLISLFIKKNKFGLTRVVFFASLILTILITLKFGQQTSLWEFIAKLPLLDSLRAMGRIILVLLFPIAYLCAIVVQSIEKNPGKIFHFLIFSIFFGLLVETMASNQGVVVPKSEWRARIADEKKRLPDNIPADAILFFAQREGEGANHLDELDAMWVSMALSKPTFNGYSGNFPPGYQLNFGKNCLELPRRVISYLNFKKQLNAENYSELIQRVLPIGFQNCQKEWFLDRPNISSSIKPYTAEEFRNLSINFQSASYINGYISFKVDIKNQGHEKISGFSLSGHPISLSYRLLNKSGLPIGASGWDSRYPLLADIPADGKLQFMFEIPVPATPPAYIELSLVQEGIFWGHDIGVTPKRISWVDLQSFRALH